MATWKRGWRTTLLDRRASLATTWAGMSRHQITDRVAMSGDSCGRSALARNRRRRRGGFETGRQVTVPGPAQLKGQSQPPGRPTCGGDQCGVVGLGKVDKPVVIAEVRGQQLGMPV